MFSGCRSLALVPIGQRCTGRDTRPGSFMFPLAADKGRPTAYGRGGLQAAGGVRDHPQGPGRSGNAVATAAVLASIDELASGEIYERVGQGGTALMQSIR